MAKKSYKKPNFKKAVASNQEKRKAENSSFSYLDLPKDVEIFKEAKGKIYVDIIPYPVTNAKHLDRDVEKDVAVVDNYWFKLPFRVHKKVGGGDGQTVVCPSTFGKKCPMCEYRKKRMSEGADKKELKDLNYTKRNLYAVIPIDNKEFEEKIHVWDTTDWFVQKLIDDELEEQEDKRGFPDLEEGQTLAFRFEEKTYNSHPYFQPNRLDFEDRDAYEEDILDDVPELDKCLKILSYNELKALLMEVDPEDLEDAENDDLDIEEEKVKKPTRRRKTNTEEKVEEEKVEDPKPTRRKKPAPVIEDEPEPEPESEEIPEGFELCEACDGTGMTAKGRKCPVCKGAGIVEIEDDSESEEEKPGDSFKKGHEALAAKKGKCPNGHKFGKDHDAHPECDDCALWNDCLDACEV